MKYATSMMKYLISLTVAVTWAAVLPAIAQIESPEIRRYAASQQEKEAIARLSGGSIAIVEQKAERVTVSRTIGELVGPAFFDEMANGTIDLSLSDVSVTFSASNPDSAALRWSLAVRARSGYLIGNFEGVEERAGKVVPGMAVNLNNRANEGAAVRLLNFYFGTHFSNISDFTSFMKKDSRLFEAMRRMSGALASAMEKPEIVKKANLSANDVTVLRNVAAGLKLFVSNLESTMNEPFFFHMEKSSLKFGRTPEGKGILVSEFRINNPDGSMKGLLRIFQGAQNSGLSQLFTLNLQHRDRERFLLDILNAAAGESFESLREFDKKIGSRPATEAIKNAVDAFSKLKSPGFDTKDVLDGLALAGDVFSSPLAVLSQTGAGRLALYKSTLSLSLDDTGKTSLNLSLAAN
jgi:hypothetical protein